MFVLHVGLDSGPTEEEEKLTQEVRKLKEELEKIMKNVPSNQDGKYMHMYKPY